MLTQLQPEIKSEKIHHTKIQIIITFKNKILFNSININISILTKKINFSKFSLVHIIFIQEKIVIYLRLGTFKI